MKLFTDAAKNKWRVEAAARQGLSSSCTWSEINRVFRFSMFGFPDGLNSDFEDLFRRIWCWIVLPSFCHKPQAKPTDEDIASGLLLWGNIGFDSTSRLDPIFHGGSEMNLIDVSSGFLHHVEDLTKAIDESKKKYEAWKAQIRSIMSELRVRRSTAA